MHLEQALKEEAARQGFILAGITIPGPPEHLDVFEQWLQAGRHGEMAYLERERSRMQRADPRQLLPECEAILVLGIPYYPSNQGIGDKGKGRPEPLSPFPNPLSLVERGQGKIAAYAWGEDYHSVIPERMKALVKFLETQLGRTVPNRWYTDSGPVLERDLAQRAGLGWIGKNTCLINPQRGSYFFLAELLLGVSLQPDPPFTEDRCGGCTRCRDACPTGCIRPDRTLDARRCISYLTIELKGEIPEQLRARLGNWVFGCDVCQQVCPWNRFAPEQGDPAFAPRPGIPTPDLVAELALTAEEFKHKFRDSPLLRAKRRGYLRNVAVALGNQGDPAAIPALERALAEDPEPLVRQHAAWAVEVIRGGNYRSTAENAEKNGGMII
jgi:epoxyqueuosine reductase